MYIVSNLKDKSNYEKIKSVHDYLIESIRMDKLDIEKKNDSFTDNHSFIYILL